MDEQHEANPGQQETPAQQASGVNWEERYKGASRTINELMTKIQGLEQQLLSKTSEMEQLRAEVTLKAKEGEIAVGARDQRLQELLNEKMAQDAELTKLRALAKKTDIAIEMGRPELMSVVKHIPDLDNEEALRAVMKDFAGFGEAMAKQREQQLMSGATLAGGQIGTASQAPGSAEAWKREIESKPVGSKERIKMLEDYGTWLQQTYGK